MANSEAEKKVNIGATLKLAFGTADHASTSRRRLIGIAQGIASGLASRFVGMLVSFLSVPLTIGYLGQERYGVWILLSSLLAWLRLADLGIGNGLLNSIATALGSERPDLVRAHISTAFMFLTAISAVVGVAVIIIWPWLDWAALFGVRGADARAEVGPAIAAAMTIFLLNFPLSVIGTSFNAFQEGRLANYWGMAGNLASLLVLFIVTRTNGGLVLLVAAVSGVVMVVSAISGIWLFKFHKPTLAPQLRAVRSSSMKGLMRVGVPFFLIQIMALIVFQTHNIFVGHFLGASDVPTYSLTYNLFGYTSLIQSIGFTYVWVAYADAIARGDVDWVKRIFKYNLAFSLGSTFVAAVPLVFIARPFIRLWTRGAVEPPEDLVLWMAGWSMINAYCSPIACLLAAASHMKAQLAYSGLAVVANVFLSIYLIRAWGISGVIAGTDIAYILFICIPILIDAIFLIGKLGARRRRVV